MYAWLLQKVFGTKHERELKKIRPLVAAIKPHPRYLHCPSLAGPSGRPAIAACGLL